MGRGFVTAAPNSGSGKTTIARGLMLVMMNRLSDYLFVLADEKE